MKQKTTYITYDGKSFNKKADAQKHEKELNSIDYKQEYFKLLKRVEQLELEKQCQLDWQKIKNPWEQGVIGKRNPDYPNCPPIMYQTMN